jgi:myo-inositol 2-dehydrogenase/D-chiro-inositol 1-dehydrogenase
MDADARVRIGLVGAGRMGSVHLRALQRADGIELAGVAEPVAAIRARLADSGITTYPDTDAMIATGRLDGVLIAAPSDQHPDLVAGFIAAGIPVLCEKPLGVQSSDTERAADAAGAADVPLQVGYWRRFVPALRALRDRIAGGELGEIYQVSCMQWDHEPPTEEFRRHSGGIAIDMAVHELDQTRWLLGQEITWLLATAADPDQNHAAADPDAALILARLSGGAAATVSLGRRFPLEDSCWVEVWGTQGHERLQFMWGADGAQVFLDAMVAQAESFARAVTGAPLEGAGGRDAVAALAAAEQAARSLEGPSVVTLPDEAAGGR